MNSHDRFVMGELGIKVLAQNDQCKRSVGDARTHFYMPHCPLRMYSNLLWANWGEDSLQRLVILGNTFSNYEHVISAA